MSHCWQGLSRWECSINVDWPPVVVGHVGSAVVCEASIDCDRVAFDVGACGSRCDDFGDANVAAVDDVNGGADFC